MNTNVQKAFAPWFDNLNQEQLDKIAENQVSLNYNKGEILSKQGGFASHIIYLTEGW